MSNACIELRGRLEEGVASGRMDRRGREVVEKGREAGMDDNDRGK